MTDKEGRRRPKSSVYMESEYQMYTTVHSDSTECTVSSLQWNQHGVKWTTHWHTLTARTLLTLQHTLYMACQIGRQADRKRLWLGSWLKRGQVVVVVAFSLLARIWGECSTIPHLCFFCFLLLFFELEVGSCTLIPHFMPGSVHSGSVSWDDCGRMFPDKLHVSCFRIGSPIMLGQRYSQPTPTSLDKGCMPN